MLGVGETRPGHTAGPEQAHEFLDAAAELLRRHADVPDEAGLRRARNQIAVRTLRELEQPGRRMEAAAQDLFVHGRLRDTGRWLQQLRATEGPAVREVFARMLEGKGAVAMAGGVAAKARDRAEVLFARS